MTVGLLAEEARERYDDWREACAAADDAYCEWLRACADEGPRAFAAYRAALEQEESLATVYRAVIGRLRPRLPSQTGAGEPAAERPGSACGGGVRVLIADRDGFACRMLQRALQEMSEVAMATGTHTGRETLELVPRCRPDLLLVDIGVPPSGGVELIRKVAAVWRQLRILTISAGAEWDQAVLAALRAGAIGHIDKDTAPDQLARLVVLAAGGQAIVPRRLMMRLLESSRTPLPAPDDRGVTA